jgi:heptosyltransferase-2
MKIAVFCPNLIGDTVMATPTFRAVRQHFPDSWITAIVRPSVAPVLSGSLWFDEIVISYHGSNRYDQRTAGVVRRLRQARHDLAILLPNSFRVALTAWMAGIPQRIGYVRYGRGILLTDRLAPLRDAAGKLRPTPIVEYYLALARALGCESRSLQLELATTPDDEAAADMAWSNLGLGNLEPVVCLNTGGAFGPAKSWPNSSFAALARRLVDDNEASVLVLCGPAERDAAREIVRQAGHPRVMSLADQELSLGLSKACVRRAALLITTDSGPRHFAAAFGTPVVTLFGPTHIVWTRTYHPRALHVFHPVPCGPCQRPICPEGHHRCMQELTPDQVYKAATLLLDRGAPSVRRELPNERPANAYTNEGLYAIGSGSEE